VPGDVTLSKVSLAADENNVLPVLEDFLTIRPDLKLIACPWSAPVWLKKYLFPPTSLVTPSS